MSITNMKRMNFNRRWMKRICLVIWIILAQASSFAQENVRVDAVGITVSDMDKALEFYTRVLPFEKISEVQVYGTAFENLKGLFGIHYKKVRLRLGSEEIELTDFLTSGGRNIPDDSRSNDLWFQHIAIVVSNMDSAYAHLQKFNVGHVSTYPQVLPEYIKPAAGIKAFYFQDPDRHTLELIFFPAGKGDPKWQQPTQRIFLGIDHTAIGVSKTDESRRFYDLLGIKKHGESINYGPEQEHLNHVQGARLRISGNRAQGGIGVEFLEYLSPKDGRPYPEASKADDLIHWETILVTTNAQSLFEKLKSGGARFISSEVVAIPTSKYGYQKGFYFRDPDGHVIGVFEEVQTGSH